MRLIDIIAGLSFPGQDYARVIQAAQRRSKSMLPLARNILERAKNAGEFDHGPTDALLASSVYLLAAARDPAVLKLSAAVSPTLWLEGDEEGEQVRLLAAGIPGNWEYVGELLDLKRSKLSAAFQISLLEAAMWVADTSSEVDAIRAVCLQTVARGDWSLWDGEALAYFFYLCAFIDREEFEFPLRLAGEFKTVRADSVEDAFGPQGEENWRSIVDSPMGHDPSMLHGSFLGRYYSDHVSPRKGNREAWPAARVEALERFNRLAAPGANWAQRFDSVSLSADLLWIATWVFSKARRNWEDFAENHHPPCCSLIAAIAVAAPLQNRRFAEAFCELLRLPDKAIECLFCGIEILCWLPSALALACLGHSELLQNLALDPRAAAEGRGMALKALLAQHAWQRVDPSLLSTCCSTLLAKRSAHFKGRKVDWDDVIDVMGAIGYPDGRELANQLLRERRTRLYRQVDLVEIFDGEFDDPSYFSPDATPAEIFETSEVSEFWGACVGSLLWSLKTTEERHAANAHRELQGTQQEAA